MQKSALCPPKIGLGQKKDRSLAGTGMRRLVLLCFFIHFSTLSFGQNNIDLSEKNISLDRFFKQLEKKSGYTFFYKAELIRGLPNITVNLKNASLEQALNSSLSTLPLSYQLVGKTVVISAKQATVNEQLFANARPDPAVFIGVVTDEQNKPLAGVNIRFSDGAGGSITDEHGGFHLIPKSTDALLLISYLGYKKQELAIKGLKNPLKIVMEPESNSLDQIQILAYGTTTRRLNTGSVTTITAEDIAKNPVTNVLQAIQGKVPGMFVQQYSGRPGTAYSVEIRGRNSISNANSGRGTPPLFIVDGVAYPFDNLPVLANDLPNILRGGNGLDFLNPAMIESMEILKDADATAIYGSRGAYGVILITTKKGKAGSPSLNINLKNGFDTRGVMPEMLTTSEYLALRREAFANDGVTPQAADLDVNGTWPEDRYTNWPDIFYKSKAFTSMSNLNYTGGSDLVHYLLGGTYNLKQDILSAKGSNRSGGLNFNVNTSTKDNKFYLGLTGSYTSTVNDNVPYDFAAASGSTNAMIAAPNAPLLYLEDGRLNWETGENPANQFNKIYKNTTNNLLSNLDVRYTPVKGLNLKTTIGYNILSAKEISGQPSTFYNPASAYVTTSTLNTFNIRTITIDPNVSYTHPLFSKGNITVTTGATLQDKLQYATTITGNDFLSDDLLYNPTFADQDDISSTYTQQPNRYLGFFGIVNYNWADKYIVNLSGRRDGSTRFGEDRQFGNFGSAAAAWIFSEESWFKDHLGFINFAKIRASIGTSGGDNIGDYVYLSTYSNAGNYQGNIALRPDRLANPNLQWETSKKEDINLTMEFLKGRIGIDASYYRNKTSNQLVNQFLSTVTGFSGIPINSPAIIRNWGYEIVLNTKNINKDDFKWSTVLNVSIPRNKLVAYPNLEVITNTNYVVGKSVTGIKLFEYAGVNPETGNYNFYKNGEIGEWTLFSGGSLDPNTDRTEFIDLSPKYYGGIQNNFRYKNITLDVFFSFTNRMGRNFLGSQTYVAGARYQNTSNVFEDRWRQPGDQTDIPRATQNVAVGWLSQSNFTQSTGAYSRATYARLQNVNISYLFPSTFLERFRLKGLSVFVQGQNLLTISKYGDLDPENLGIGTAPLRTFTGGLNITL